jgi:hypothetical protein
MEVTHMKEKGLEAPNIRWVFLAVAVTLSFGLLTGPAMSADTIDPDADKILQSMSTYLGGLSAFSMNADIDNEIVDLAGQKLQLSSGATIIMERPGKFYIHRQGAYADAEFIFNGEVLTLHGIGKNVYRQINSPGSTDNAFNTLEIETGLDVPGADLLLENAYPSLTSNINSGTYLGTAYVSGIECHYMAFRQDRVDWQLWVQAGETPLPMKYIITSKWVTGAPQYTIQFRDWNTKPQIEADQFSFTVPKGARKIETIPVNEIGELMIEEGQK